MVCSSLCLSSSDSWGDRASCPSCTREEEQQPPKDRTVREVERMSPAIVASLVARPSVRGGSDCRELSWSRGDSGGLGDVTPARNRFSSQRKEDVCEATLGETNKQASLGDPRKTSRRNRYGWKTLCHCLFLPRKAEAAPR